MALGGVTFQLTGDKHLDRLFKALPGKVQKKVLRPALRAAAKVILPKAKAFAPKRTGALGKSLKVRAGRRTRRDRTMVRMQVVTQAGFFRGAEFYGAFQEFGWKTGRRRSKNRRQVPGKHFIERAFRATAAQAKQVALQGIKEGIIREATRGIS